jgi:glutamine amidotransferase
VSGPTIAPGPVVIVDYGLGNVRSIQNMLRRIEVPATISRDPSQILAAGRLILPGVGAFDTAMRLLDESGARPALEEAVRSNKTAVLGICLGMQLLGRTSEEGDRPGLGWIGADTRRLPASREVRVPHMGWDWVEPTRPSRLFASPEADLRFYFVHSFAVVCDDPSHVIATTRHGEEFTSAVAQENVFGVQFHPEKSHRFGMELLRNFVCGEG